MVKLCILAVVLTGLVLAADAAHSWGPWTQWSACNATCDGYEHRTRNCMKHALTQPAAQGTPDNSSFCHAEHSITDLETRQCSGNCPLLRRATNGYSWGPWSGWSSCHVTCGGTASRQRSCHMTLANRTLSTYAYHCGSSTVSHTDHYETETRNCSSVPCIVSFWSSWSDWSPCSATCDPGTRYRARHCESGTDCVGNVFQQESCDEGRCLHPMDGAWSVWDSWSTCSVSCGQGYNVRYRFCNNPAPQDGGAQCEGKHDEVRVCPLVHCPVDGGWSNWTESHCTVTCGVGLRYFIRKCNDPLPMYGGNECVGESAKFERCIKDACVIDGDWSSWSDYTNCRVICGDGYQRRNRSCTNPPPQAGGMDCMGDTTDRLECHNGACPADIKICDKAQVLTLTSQATPQNLSLHCSSDELMTVGSQVLQTHCGAPGDVSKWRLGKKINNDCEILPLHIPVGHSDNGVHIREYGVMLDCHDNTLQMVTKACGDQVRIYSYNLTDTYSNVHMLIFED